MNANHMLEQSKTLSFAKREKGVKLEVCFGVEHIRSIGSSIIWYGFPNIGKGY
jgi:hypothetical protein